MLFSSTKLVFNTTLCCFLFLLCCSASIFSSEDYANALEKSILFFEGQRSGKLPPRQRVAWRADSALSDGSGYHVDLVGGYYDAGDNVKFGLPMAFTTTLLAWSVIEFETSISMRNQLDNAKEAVRWGSDYLLKAATATPGVVYVQVGDPNNDHRCWERAEDMDTARNVYKVSPENPGSDVAAETAAALAAASIVFKDSDATYSSKLLKAAIKVFDFADRYKGAYSDSLGSVVCPFYCSYSGYHDELLWGASWLHLASTSSNQNQSSYYLSYIESNGHTLGGDDDDSSFTFSWDDKRAGTKILMLSLSSSSSSKSCKEKINTNNNNQGLMEVYKTHSHNYICSLIPGSPNLQAQYTPGGLFYKATESNLQYVTTSTFLLLVYAKYLDSHSHGTSVQASSACTITSNKQLVSLAKKQVDYILGDNPLNMSYMVGFGHRYPLHVHHRGSSLPSTRTHPAPFRCADGFDYLHTGDPNPNLLIGAVLGGPDNRDSFADDRHNYHQSEPATYINAPFVGALAFFSADQ